MLTILAVIGLLFLCYYASKGLKRFGKWSESIGNSLIDFSDQLSAFKDMSSRDRRRAVERKKDLEYIKKGQDESYMKRVRDEIEDLTRTD